MAAYRPDMPMTMNQVIHAAVRRDLTRLDRALDAFPSGDAERANQLARAYRFLRHQLTDHHQSEDELEPVLAAYLETPEWKGVEKQLRRRPMSEIGPFLAWLQDGQEPPVRTGLRSTIPPPVLVAIPALFGRSYTRRIAPVWQG